MIITLKDGSTKEYAQPMSVYEIAKDISEGLARVATAGELDGEVVDLRTVVEKDSNLNILTFDDEKAEVLKEVYRSLNRMDIYTEQVTVKETRLETQEDGSVVPVEQEVVKTYLYIDTVSLTAEEAANLYGFDTKQREQLGELLSDRNKEMWDALLPGQS